MIRPFNSSAPSLLFGCLFSPLLLADEAPLELNQQIICAPSVESTTVADMAHYGSKVDIVSREQIERAGPAADVSRVMQVFIPGLYVAPKNGPFDYGTYSLLGGRNDDTLILLDGVRLNNRLYGGLYLDTLPANAIERIEVLKGGQSLLFGTQAVSGVINIVTRSPQRRKASGEVNMGLDTFGGTTGDARVENIFSNGFGDLGLLAYVSHNVSDGYQPFRNRDMKNVTEKKRAYEVTTFGGKAIQSFGDDSRLELFYQYADANLDFARPVGNHKTTNDRVQQIATATFEQNLNERLSYFVKGHVNDWDTRYTRINNVEAGATKAINHNDYWGFTDWGVQAEGKAESSGGHVLVFGTDNQWFKGQDDVLIIDNDKAEAHAIYTQLRPQIDALPDWHPSIGVRHEAMGGGDSATVGMLTSLYDLNDNWALRGQYGSAYKLPNAEQLFVNEPGDEIGNRNLKPEKSRNAELGLDYKGLLLNRAFSASVTVFKRKIDDLITLDDSHWVNGEGQVRMRGFEADAKLAINAQWSLQADMTRNLTESSSGVTINDIPSFFARSRIGFESENRLWGAGGAIRYIRDVTSSKQVKYGHYSVIDADAYRYLDNARQHRVSLLVENLFDRDYVTSRASNVDNLGRPFISEVRYTYRF